MAANLGSGISCFASATPSPLFSHFSPFCSLLLFLYFKIDKKCRNMRAEQMETCSNTTHLSYIHKRVEGVGGVAA